MKVCNRCVMDTSAKNIYFDSDGNCNFCNDYIVRLKDNQDFTATPIGQLISDIKRSGEGREYDCIVGVSGGVDSSWVLVKAVELGLNPLAVHMDNGWNSELAQNNISNLVNKLDVDLYTHVIDWEEYRIMMEAFFAANVVDIELLYDNAMLAVNYNIASKFGIKYILCGDNISTEGMAMPEGWNWYKKDKLNILDICKSFGVKKLKTFPTISTFRFVYLTLVKKITWTPILNSIEFNKEDVLSILEREYGYKRYPYKHYESIFTRFYQGYILPNKFAIDKRKLHLSTLVISGQMSREEALEDLKHIAYHSQKELDSDRAYFLKKMVWTEDKLNSYINSPRIEHDRFKNEYKFWCKLKRIHSWLFRK